MPRYMLETVMVHSADLDAAVDLASQRFPEIDVERCDTTGDGVDARVLWMCRAPSETHLHRWAAAAGVAVTSVRRLAPIDSRKQTNDADFGVGEALGGGRGELPRPSGKEEQGWRRDGLDRDGSRPSSGWC